jgi:hypothetical protein
MSAATILFVCFWLATVAGVWRGWQLWRRDLPGREEWPVEWKRSTPFISIAMFVCVTLGGIVLAVRPERGQLSWPAFATVVVLCAACLVSWRIAVRLWRKAEPSWLVPPRLRRGAGSRDRGRHGAGA